MTEIKQIDRAIKAVNNEIEMRKLVFRNREILRDIKVREMENVLSILENCKNKLIPPKLFEN